METASGNFRTALLLAVFSTLLVTGCVANMPARPGNEAATEAPDSDRQHQIAMPGSMQAGSGAAAAVSGSADTQAVTLSVRDAPLPRQAYDDRGVKIPYVAQPNPYTGGNAAVPAEARTMFLAASVRLSEGNLSAAESKFREIAEKYPDLSGPWVKLGEIAEQRSQPEQAIDHYRHAISLNPDNVNAYIMLGLVQRRLGNFRGAQEAYLAALDVWKDFPEAHLNLAILYDLYANQAEAAQKHYEAYFFLAGGKDEQAHKWLVEVRQRTGIEQSFIDSPPAVAVTTPSDGSADTNGVATGKGL